MLDKILEQQQSQSPEKVINKMVYTNKYIPEMAKQLAEKIEKTAFEYTAYIEFIFEKDNYSFCCDVRTRDHGKQFETCCGMSFIDGDEIQEPGILYELEFETKKLL